MLQTKLTLHNADAEVLATFDLKTSWQGSRYMTARKVIAQAESFYAYLAYPDADAEAALFFGCGRSALDYAQSILRLCDWQQGALSCQYQDMQRRNRTAVFTLNKELGAKLAPTEQFYLTDADKAFKIAFGG